MTNVQDLDTKITAFNDYMESQWFCSYEKVCNRKSCIKMIRQSLFRYYCGITQTMMDLEQPTPQKLSTCHFVASSLTRTLNLLFSSPKCEQLLIQLKTA